MPNTVIQLKKSSTVSAVPSALEFGELAVNYADGKIYYKNSNSFIVEFSPGGGNYFGTVDANGTILVADTTGDILTIAPGNNITIVGDAINDKLTIGARLVQFTNTAPSNPLGGDLWFNTEANVSALFAYYVEPTSSQWVQIGGSSGGGGLTSFTQIIANGNTIYANTTTSNVTLIPTGSITISSNTQNNSIFIGSTASGTGTGAFDYGLAYAFKTQPF